MDRSLGFGSITCNYTPYSDSVSLRLRDSYRLTSLHIITRRLILQKARRHPFGLRPLVGPWFQVLFHSPPGVLFTFPSRYYALSVAAEYLALEGGPPGFRQDSTCPAVLRYALHCPQVFAYGDFTLSVRLSQVILLTFGFLQLCRCALQPHICLHIWFGLLPVRSPLLGESHLDFFSCWYLDGSLPSVCHIHTIYSYACDSHSRLSGYPIRKSRDQGLLAAPPRLSQLSTSFFAWQLLGIHAWTLLHLTILFFRFLRYNY